VKFQYVRLEYTSGFHSSIQVFKATIVNKFNNYYVRIMFTFRLNNLSYLLCLVYVFFNRQSAYPWVQTVLFFSPTCSVIRMRQSSYRASQEKRKEAILTSSGISYHLRDIYSIYRRCWNVATYKWKVHNGKIEIISFVVTFRSQPPLTVNFEV
jgi:hypothetical protein